MVRHASTALLSAAVFGLAFGLLGCSTYRDQLDRADEHYRSAHYEWSLANLSDLEDDLDRLDPSERVRYEYVRGMTHARLGQRSDARHWLAIAREHGENEGASSMTEAMRSLMTRTLQELDGQAERDREAARATSGGEAPATSSR